VTPEWAVKQWPVGAKVRTQYKFYGRRRLGVVESRNGAYVMVRLNYQSVLIEAYDSELGPIK
jgi:hypothetical protein